jgi:pseudouridylate synthase
MISHFPSTFSISASLPRLPDQKIPIVALESTVITHGLPRPQNLVLARDMERIIRENGAVAATIALLDGKVHIGLTDT